MGRAENRSRWCRVVSAAVVAVVAAVAGGCFNVSAYPPASVCAQDLEPLGRPTFSAVTVAGAIPPVVSGDHPPPPTADQFREVLEAQLRAIPYFSGGPGPEVTVSVTVDEFDSGIGGCWALLIPDVLLFPAWWLVGAPIACYYVTVDSTWEVSVEGFRRQYAFTMTDYSVRGMYYSGELFLHGDAYLGQTVWVLAQRLREDFAAFQAGRLPAAPEPHAEELDPDDETWWNPLQEGGATCRWLPDLNPLSPEELAAFTEIGTAVGLFLGSTEPAVRVDAARSLGTLGGRAVLVGSRDAADIRDILVGQRETASDPAIIAAIDEALAVIACADECLAASGPDCTATCNLDTSP